MLVSQDVVSANNTTRFRFSKFPCWLSGSAPPNSQSFDISLLLCRRIRHFSDGFISEYQGFVSACGIQPYRCVVSILGWLFWICFSRVLFAFQNLVLSLQKVAKSYKQLQKSCKQLQNVAKNAQRDKHIQKVAKSCKQLQKVATRCKKLQQITNSCKKLKTSCKQLQQVAESCKSCKKSLGACVKRTLEVKIMTR